jgi:hypothetical protein
MENVKHSHEKQNEWHKKNQFIHQNVLPNTNWQNVTKSWQDKQQNKLPAEQNSHFPPKGRGSRVYPNVGAAGCTLTSGQPCAAWSGQEVCSGFALAACAARSRLIV